MIGGGPLTSNRRFAAEIVALNYQTTVNLMRLLQATRKLDSLSLFVYFSSLAAMGIPGSISDTIVYSESTSCNPVLPYEEAKLKTEEFLEETTRQANFKTVILRFPQIYGGENDSLVQMTSLIRKGTFPVVRNKIGTLPLLHVEDAAKATCMVINNYALIQRKYDVNVVCEGSYSYRDLDVLVREKYGTGRTVKLPYALFHMMVLFIEILFKVAGKPEPLNRRRLLSMTKDRIVDCRKFVRTFNFEFDHNLPSFLCDSLR
jgi:nucleoside-diphosphate-sugar epimerase